MGRLLARGGWVLLVTLAVGTAAVTLPAQGQEKKTKKAVPGFTFRRVSLPKGEQRAVEVVKEYQDEGWELTAKNADGLGTFRRPFVTAEKLGQPKVLAKLQGTWRQVSPERDPPLTIEVTGNRHATKLGDKVTQAGTIQYLRQSDDLILVDLHIVRADTTRDRGDTARAIAAIDGDSMKYCTAGALARRPRSFEVKEGDGYESIVFKKVK